MTGAYLFVWVLLAIVAILNGIVRQSTYGRRLPELVAHQLSTAIAMLASAAVVFAASCAWPLDSAAQAWTIGLTWLVMTVAFEFGFGRFVARHPWRHLVADYNLLKGRVWVVFLAWIAILPWLIFRLGQVGS